MASEAWSHGSVRVEGVRIHYVRAGQGAPVVLLHGWPQTWYMWRKVIPGLAKCHLVIAPDLRGVGDSETPLAGYDRGRVAADVRGLLKHLGVDRSAVVGHDIGGNVALRYALDYPEATTRLMILDVVPYTRLFTNLNATVAVRLWHFFFHAQPDLPEWFVGDRVADYLRYVFHSRVFDPTSFGEAEIATYARAYGRPGALRGGFEHYRTCFGESMRQDLDDLEAGRRVAAPVRVLWGDAGPYRDVNALDLWRPFAPAATGVAIPECGHYLPEERPEAVLAEMEAFLGAHERTDGGA